jgi:4-amino-4-deoxy-L-arabinose transferase-like glycosyltransferase
MDASRSRPRPGLAILVIAATLAAGLGTPWFLDYDEAVYADVARQMWASGDWLRPASNCEPFYEKPILFYWLAAALYELLGLTPVAPRLVSALALLVGLAFLAREVSRRANPEAAEAAVWVAGASLLPFSLGRVGLLDALLTTAMTVALLAFLRGLGEENPRRRRGALALGYAATGVSLAVKGPAFPLIAAGVLLCDALARRDVRRTLRRSGMLWGAPLVLAVGVPPYILAARAAGPVFLTEFFGEHNLGRLLAPMQGHQGSPLYYLVVLAVGLLPFSPFLPQALLRVGRSDPRSRRLGSFAIIWGLLVLVGFSLVATKLPNYIAPAFPAFAIVVALALTGDTRKAGAGWHVTVVLCVGFSLLIAALPALLARLPLFVGQEVLRRAPELAHLPGGPWPRLGFFLAAALLAGGSASAWLLARRDPRLRAVRALGITGALAWSVLLISLGDLVNATSIAPVRNLAVVAAQSLQPGAPIHVVEMNHRVAQNLATGRCTVFLRARTPAERNHVREILARDGAVRMIMGDVWWEELQPTVGGRELARDGAYVLVTGGG